MEVEDETPRPCKKVRQENKKVVWMLTYASGRQEITSSMLHENNIRCDEVYTTTWRESTYTLVHVESRHPVRAIAFRKAMHSIKEKYGIKGSSVFGYDGLVSNTRDSSSVDINEHPGFKRMVQLLNEDREKLSIWLSSGDVDTNKKALLWQYLELTDLKEMTKTHVDSAFDRLLAGV